MPSSFVPYEISPECIFYARGRHRDPEESLINKHAPSPGTLNLNSANRQHAARAAPRLAVVRYIHTPPPLGPKT